MGRQVKMVSFGSQFLFFFHLVWGELGIGAVRRRKSTKHGRHYTTLPCCVRPTYASTWLANHALSLSSAFPRCEILFFSLLSISAYVVPSYSKQESQPGVFSMFPQLQRHHVLTEHRRPSTRNQLAVRPALEQHRFVAWTLAVGKCADGLRGLVVEAVEHVVQFGWAEREHEPFSREEKRGQLLKTEMESCLRGRRCGMRRVKNSHVRSGEVVHSFKTQTRVFDEDGTVDLYTHTSH